MPNFLRYLPILDQEELSKIRYYNYYNSTNINIYLSFRNKNTVFDELRKPPVIVLNKVQEYL